MNTHHFYENQFLDMFNVLIGDGCGRSSTPPVEAGRASGVDSTADFLNGATGA